MLTLAASGRTSTTGPGLIVAGGAIAHGRVTSWDADATTVGWWTHILRLPGWRYRYGGEGEDGRSGPVTSVGRRSEGEERTR